MSIVADLANALVQRGWMLATAESCTGGLIACTCTDLPGSSGWFDRGLVTYSNDAKQSMLGVSAQLIEHEGAVSEMVVRAMAEGLLACSSATITIAVSGVAGPAGGRDDKPVGTVWVAWAVKNKATYAQHFLFAGDRHQVRVQACDAAIKGALVCIKETQA